MSYRGRRRGGWRLPDEEIRNRRAASSSIRLASEFTHILLGKRRVLMVIAAGLISVAAIGAFKLHKTYADYAAIVDERLDQRTSGHLAGVYAAPRERRATDFAGRIAGAIVASRLQGRAIGRFCRPIHFGLLRYRRRYGAIVD